MNWTIEILSQCNFQNELPAISNCSGASNAFSFDYVLMALFLCGEISDGSFNVRVCWTLKCRSKCEKFPNRSIHFHSPVDVVAPTTRIYFQSIADIKMHHHLKWHRQPFDNALLSANKYSIFFFLLLFLRFVFAIFFVFFLDFFFRLRKRFFLGTVQTKMEMNFSRLFQRHPFTFLVFYVLVSSSSFVPNRYRPFKKMVFVDAIPTLMNINERKSFDWGACVKENTTQASFEPLTRKLEEIHFNYSLGGFVVGERAKLSRRRISTDDDDLRKSFNKFE